MFQPPPPFSSPQRRALSAGVKGALGMKACGAIAAIVLSAVLLVAFNDRSKWPEGMTTELAHRFASFALLATGASLAELLGVAGTWSFKRWGVYALAGSSMIGFVFRISGGDKIGAVLSVASTAIVGLAVASRWSDFE
jgi:hypothetical protein